MFFQLHLICTSTTRTRVFPSSLLRTSTSPSSSETRNVLKNLYILRLVSLVPGLKILCLTIKVKPLSSLGGFVQYLSQCPSSRSWKKNLYTFTKCHINTAYFGTCFNICPNILTSFTFGLLYKKTANTLNLSPFQLVIFLYLKILLILYLWPSCLVVVLWQKPNMQHFLGIKRHL